MSEPELTPEEVERFRHRIAFVQMTHKGEPCACLLCTIAPKVLAALTQRTEERDEQAKVIARVTAILADPHKFVEPNYDWAMRRIEEAKEALSPTTEPKEG